MKKILVKCRRTLDSAADLSITGPILVQNTPPPHAGSKPVKELCDIQTATAGAGEGSSDTPLRKYQTSYNIALTFTIIILLSKSWTEFQNYISTKINALSS